MVCRHKSRFVAVLSSHNSRLFLARRFLKFDGMKTHIVYWSIFDTDLFHHLNRFLDSTESFIAFNNQCEQKTTGGRSCNFSRVYNVPPLSCWYRSNTYSMRNVYEMERCAPSGSTTPPRRRHPQFQERATYLTNGTRMSQNSLLKYHVSWVTFDKWSLRAWFSKNRDESKMFH